jgi:hypothetical protein
MQQHACDIAPLTLHAMHAQMNRLARGGWELLAFN